MYGCIKKLINDKEILENKVKTLEEQNNNLLERLSIIEEKIN